MIRALWKRTIQVRPYESETLELAIESEPNKEISEVAELSRNLSALGDELIRERLAAHKQPSPKDGEFVQDNLPDDPWNDRK